MQLKPTKLQDVLLIQPRIFADDRGVFYESYQKKVMADMGIQDEFVQDNVSLSQKGVLRGLHFQKAPFAQSKLVQVLSGSVKDVVVDLRISSSTYGQYESFELSSENRQLLYVPKGCAHGFLSLENNTLFHYACGEYYTPQAEQSLLWSDPQWKIQWDVENPLLSAKDAAAEYFDEKKHAFV